MEPRPSGHGEFLSSDRAENIGLAASEEGLAHSRRSAIADERENACCRGRCSVEAGSQLFTPITKATLLTG